MSLRAAKALARGLLMLTHSASVFPFDNWRFDMMFPRPSLMATIVLAIALSAAPSQAAESADATLTGVVRSPAKAPIAGATVTATNQATKASQTATTGADGSYTLSLPPGSYSVKAAASGFRVEARPADVAAGAPGHLDFSLDPMLSEVVTVTAMKRETAAIDAPISVATRTEQEIRDHGVENIEGLAADVPGFTVQSLGPGQSQVAMRGVSAGQIARDQPGVKEQVGIYLDESPVSLSLFTPDLDLVDVNRVEVLRGPQGTLFGSGSVTGTVRYVTNQPQQDSTDGFVELGGGLVEDGSGTGDIKAGVNVPLGHTVAARVVGYYTHLSGFTDAVQPNLSVDRNVNDGFRKGARAAITWAPNAGFSITPRVVYQRVESNGWNLSDAYNILANPFTTTRPPVELGKRQEFTQLGEHFQDDYVLADLDLRYNFRGMTLTSITSFIDRDINIVRDTTALTASFTGGNIGFPEPIYTLSSPLFDNTHGEDWTQELRLSGGQKRVQWLGGAFYSHAVRDYGQNVSVPGFENATGIPTKGLLAPKDSIYFSQLGYHLDQIAFFGEGTVSATPRFSVTGGLRWYHYAEDKTELIDGVFGNMAGNGVNVISLPGTTSADGLAPRVIATYKLSDDANFNAQISRGFRLGGINDPLNTVLCSPQDLITFGGHDTWDDEKVWNYEVGYKSSLMGGRGSFDASLFYIDIHDLQTTVTAGTCSSRLVFNVPHARSQGVEVAFKAAPAHNFDLSVSGSYNDSEIRSTLTSTDPNGVVSVVSGIEKGRRLPSVPQVQVATSATYKFDVSGGSQVYVTGTWQHIGSRFTQVGDQDLGRLDLTTFGPNTIGGPLTANAFRYNPELPAYDLLNFRVGLRRVKWDISAYVNNATNQLALLALDRERGTLARLGYLTNQPRTFGITTRYNF
ncbi:MAG: TonB-dependent receptor [Acidobacteria bacterium]|nr:TonB-dependent receptor [Acidobacteriota bacterium]